MSDPSEKILITGASGSLGKQLVYELVCRGIRPIAHHRAESDIRYLKSLQIELRTADLRIQPELNRLMEGVDKVIHTAAWVDFRRDRFTHFTGINTFGAVKSYQAAKRAGVKRFVHISTVAAVGASPRSGESSDLREPPPINEDFPFNLEHLHIPYILTKHAAEIELLKIAQDGKTELIIINPSIIVAPSRTGDDRSKAIRIFSRSIMPDYSNWVNLVDIRDIAPAIVNALERGRPGERYILAGDNIKVRDLILGLSVILQKAPHLVQPPRAIVNMAARLSLWYSTVLSQRKVSFYPDLVRMIDYDWVFSSMKAQRELGFKSRSIQTTMQALLTNRFIGTHMKSA